jgi:hypothetical protein
MGFTLTRRSILCRGNALDLNQFHSAELLNLIVVFAPLFTKPVWEYAKVLPSIR